MFGVENSNIIAWTIGVIIVVPIITIILGEIIDRLRSRGSYYLHFFENVRGVVFPSFIAYILAKHLFHLDTFSANETEISLQLIYSSILSILTLSTAYVAFILLRSLKHEKNPEAWENRIPGLFKAVFTIMVFVIPIILLLNIWGVEVGNFAKYASLAAAATAFALQDALSSITKGFLLVLDKPFAVGDWIEVNGVRGKVLDISWRSTRIQVSGRDIVVIPNLIISDNSVYNYTAVDISYRDSVEIGFSYGDSPNKVKQVMFDILQDCPGILQDPSPEIITLSYGDFSINYTIFFHVKLYAGFLEQRRIRDDVLSRIWYAADRGGLSIPFPIQVEGPPSAFERDTTALRHDINDFLSQNSYFSVLPKETLQQLAMTVEIIPFAKGETIFKEGGISDGLSILHKGEIEIFYHKAPLEQNTENVYPGALIGLMALLGRRANLSTAKAVTDSEILKFTVKSLDKIIADNPKFSQKLNTVIDRRMLHAREGVDL
ncbi:MAG: mechanosensitive ion channel domain-containing protein [Cocleimonas sp.]